MPSADSNEWSEDRIRRVIDVSTSRKGYQLLTEDTVRELFQSFGEISNIYSWASNARKSHFYVEFQSQAGFDKAREASIPGLNPAGILNDSQHRKRLIALSNSSPKYLRRYSPYELRSASTSRASLPVAVEQGGFASSQHVHQIHPQSSRSNLPEDPNDGGGPMPLDNGFQSVASTDPLIAPFRLSPPHPVLQSIPETIDIPILGETVKFPANSASTLSGISVLLRSTSDHTMQFGSEGLPPFLNPTLPSTQTAPSSRSSELSVEEMLDVLTEVRNNKAQERGQDASTSATSTRPLQQFQIHPKFDFRKHILSGRFLNSDHAHGHMDDNTNDDSFQLTPLQAYFADIYASLQTELQHTKRRNRQDLLLLEKQRILTEQYKQEAADERNARRNAEKALAAVQEQWERNVADGIAHQQAAEKAEANLRKAKGEVEKLKAALAQIGSVYTETMACPSAS